MATGDEGISPTKSPAGGFSIPMERMDEDDLFSSRSLRYHEQYIARIRDCFRCFPRAPPFYQPLIEYLSNAKQAGFSGLQTPVSYLLEQKPSSRDVSPIPLTRNSTTSSQSAATKPRKSPRRTSRAPSPPEQQQSQITVVEGFLAPETIGVLGEKYRVRPEFFINHLAPLNRTCGHPHGTGYGGVHRHERSHSPSSTIPSLRDNMIHVRFLSILETSRKGGGNVSNLKDTAAQVAQAFYSCSPIARRRAAMNTKLCMHEQWLFNRHYGATRFRALHVHNDRCITVEQMVSFTVTGGRDGGWHGMVFHQVRRILQKHN